MPVKMSNVNRGSSRRLASTSKGKISVAAGLVALMVFMWARVLTSDKSGPSEANAATTADTTNSSTESQEVKLTYIKLPVVPGRNDSLTNDMFADKAWMHPSNTKNIGAVTTSANDQKIYTAIMEAIAKTLKVDSISPSRRGQRPDAFIENKLLIEGSMLPISYENKTYEFTVDRIYEDRVMLKWKDFSIAVKVLSELSN